MHISLDNNCGWSSSSDKGAYSPARAYSYFLGRRNSSIQTDMKQTDMKQQARSDEVTGTEHFLIPHNGNSAVISISASAT